MASWVFEPGHTAAEFASRHMMVCFVRGHFKNVEGTLEFDPANPGTGSVEAQIAARGIWSGEQARDDHLRSADFLDVDNHPEISFKGDEIEVLSSHDYQVTGDLTIRGVSRSNPGGRLAELVRLVLDLSCSSHLGDGERVRLDQSKNCGELNAFK